MKHKKSMRLKTISFLMFCCFLFLVSCLYAQKESFQTPDSLKNKDYGYLFNRFLQKSDDTISAKLYLNAYLSLATINEDKVKRSIAYNYLSYYTKHQEIKLELIHKSLSESSTLDSLYSITAYNNLGLYYQYNYNYEKALQYFFTVRRIAKKKNYIDYEIIALNNIADIKQGVGKHKEALELYRKCFNLEKNKRDHSYSSIGLISINLAQSFRKNKEYDSASYYYELAINKLHIEDSYNTTIATINEGINLFFKGQIKDAKALLEKGAYQIDFSSSESLNYYTLSQFYLGKISLLSDENKGRIYFNKVDSLLLSNTNISLPEVREVYEFFINDSKKEKNLLKELDITNKLLAYNNIILTRNLNTTNKLHFEFDTPELLQSKNLIIKKIETKAKYNRIKVFFLLIVILFFLSLLILQLRKHKIYKRRFKNILEEMESQIIDKKELGEKKITFKKINIDNSIVVDVLTKLAVFESKKEFLQNTITISSLSKKCSTNTKYLSKIINTNKEKSFIKYINDLRIDYVLKELKTNRILQRYTILSIAKEIGFNSADSFSLAFKKKTGITPAFFIKKIKNNKSV